MRGKFDQLALPPSYGLSDAVSRLRQKLHTDPEVSPRFHAGTRS